MTELCLEPKSEQEVFEVATRHLLQQMAVSREGGLCAYRGGGGLMCAAGPFIPDEVAQERNIASLSGILRAFPEVADNLCKFTDLLYALQNIHDNGNPTDWRTALKKLGNARGLLVSFIADIPEVPIPTNPEGLPWG